MTNRGIQDQALLNAIGAQTVQYYECVFIDVDTGIYITNSPRDITFGGVCVDNPEFTTQTTCEAEGHTWDAEGENTYNAFGQLISLEAINENTSFQIPTLKIGISGIATYETVTNLPVIQFMLENPHIDRTVTITRAYYDHDAYIGGFEVFSGRITSVQMSHSPTTSTVVIIDVSSHWDDFNRGEGRKTNPTSQQQYYPNDKGFDYAENTMVEIEWKEEE